MKNKFRKFGLSTFLLVIIAFSVLAGTEVYENEIKFPGESYIVQPGNVSDVQAKMNSCSGSCVVTLPKGVYNMTTHITMTNNTHIRCEPGAVFRKTINDGVIEATTTVENVTVSGCTFDINDRNESGIYLPRVFNAEFYNNKFFNGDSDASFMLYLGSGTANASNIRVHDNLFDSVQNGIGIEGNNTIISNNVLISTTKVAASPSEYGEGIEINDGAFCTITGNIVLGFQENGIDANALYSTVVGNTVSASNDPRRTDLISVRNNHAVISGNYIYGIQTNDTGIYAGASDESLIYGNLIQSNGSGVGINVNSQDNVAVYGNKYFNLSTDLSNGNDVLINDDGSGRVVADGSGSFGGALTVAGIINMTSGDKIYTSAGLTLDEGGSNIVFGDISARGKNVYLRANNVNRIGILSGGNLQFINTFGSVKAELQGNNFNFTDETIFQSGVDIDGTADVETLTANTETISGTSNVYRLNVTDSKIYANGASLLDEGGSNINFGDLSARGKNVYLRANNVNRLGLLSGGDVWLYNTFGTPKAGLSGSNFNVTENLYVYDEIILDDNNVTGVDCITFTSGGKICSGS